MSISEEDQRLINFVVETLKKAEAGDQEKILRPQLDLIVQICDEFLEDRNPATTEFVHSIFSFSNSRALTLWAAGNFELATSPFSVLADRIRDLFRKWGVQIGED